VPPHAPSPSPASPWSPGGAAPAPYAVDVVLLSPLGARLAVLLEPLLDEGTGERTWALPWGTRDPADPTIEACAHRIATAALAGGEVSAPTWLAQAAAFDDADAHPGEIDLSVTVVGTVPAAVANRAPAPHGETAAWFTDVPPLPARHRAALRAGIATIRRYVDSAPVAFRLLPPAFTLSALQQVYEILLGHRLHKASFRRALQAAALVEATDEWRREGRGRPAQLFRYAPRRRRPTRRAVRFELLRG
jgi:8-oxo-dGTP diphosphatase